MRKLASFVLALVAITLTGCLDSFDELTIAPDGSGTYRSTMDMSGMFDMLDMLAAMDTSSNSQLKQLSNKDFDSTMSMRSVVDTATNLTENEKALLRNATLRMTMKQQARVFKLGMDYPFQKLDDIQKILELNRKGKGLSALGGSGKSALPGMGEEMGGMDDFNGFYDMTVTNGVVERKINMAKVNELKEGKMKELGQAEEMLEKVTFKTVINLPRPVTKLTGEAAKLSDDKKSVTIRSSMLDLMKAPQRLAFRIEY